MARNRQRAKERQAARRAREASGESSRPDERLAPESAAPGVLGQSGQVYDPEPAPPEDLGHPDDVLEDEPDLVDEAADRELELEAEEAGATASRWRRRAESARAAFAAATPRPPERSGADSVGCGSSSRTSGLSSSAFSGRTASRSRR